MCYFFIYFIPKIPVLLGIIAHRLFCVRTTADKLIFSKNRFYKKN
jgi:hypothetical protein